MTISLENGNLFFKKIAKIACHGDNIEINREEWLSELRRYIYNLRFLVLTPLGAQLGFGTQPLYEALGDLWVEISIRNIELVKLTPCQWPKAGGVATK